MPRRVRNEAVSAAHIEVSRLSSRRRSLGAIAFDETIHADICHREIVGGVMWHFPDELRADRVTMIFPPRKTRTRFAQGSIFTSVPASMASPPSSRTNRPNLFTSATPALPPIVLRGLRPGRSIPPREPQVSEPASGRWSLRRAGHHIRIFNDYRVLEVGTVISRLDASLGEYARVRRTAKNTACRLLWLRSSERCSHNTTSATGLGRVKTPTFDEIENFYTQIARFYRD